MKNQRCKWLGLALLSLATLFVMGGCGGGSSSTPPSPVAKAAINGSVSFPLIDNMVAKRVPKSVAALAPAYGFPTVELRNLGGGVVATATVTGTGPYSYTFSNIDMGADYVVKAYVPNTNYVVKALIDKSALTTTTTRNVDTVSTTVVIVTEQRLGATPGTMGDIANASKFTTGAIADVNPVALEGAINTAIGSVTGTNAVNASENDIKLMNLVNVVTSTVFSDVKTSDFIAGTVTAPISTTQYTYAANTAPAVATVEVQSATVYTAIVAPTQTAYTPPPADSVTLTSRVMDFSSTTPVALQGVEVTANGLKTFTDASGFYTLAGITKDTSFYVKMSKAGYADSYSAQQNISANSNSSTRPYALWTPSILTAWGNTPGTGVISSRVVESTNLDTGYLGGVVVTAADSQDPAITYPVIYTNTSGNLDSTLTSTSANGRWMFRNVPAGRTVNVTATKSGFTFNTRTFLVVADSVSQGRITGTAAAVVVPPPTTASALKESLLAGWFEFRSDSIYNLATGTNTNYYHIERIGLAADGATLTNTTVLYHDRASNTWTSAIPAGFPANNSTDFTLSSGGVWISEPDGPQGFTVVFNADGTARLTNPASGEIIDVSVNPVDISGQAISASDLDGSQLTATSAVYPSGAVKYNLTITSLADSYQVWGSYFQLTTLTSVPAAFAESSTTGNNNIYIESPSDTEYFFGKFADGSTTNVNIYRNTNTSQTAPQLIGTATAATVTVSGQQILEISIPAALRTSYSLSSNPIFAVVNGIVMQGVHSFAGVDQNKGGSMLNDIAINHAKANINFALAKPAGAKSISKALLGM